MELLTRFGNIICQWKIGLSSSLWDSWKWRLDPYIVFESREDDISICVEFNPLKTYELKSGYEEFFVRRDGFLTYLYYKNKESQDIVWKVVRATTKEEYLVFHISCDRKKITILKDETYSDGNVAFVYLGKIFPNIATQFDMLMLHGVLLEYKKKGIIISAPSGTGKTTHARMWRDYKDALILNGDCSACHLDNTHWIGCGLPWSGTSGEQINRKVPIVALVVLKRGVENKTVRIEGMEAFHEVFPNLLFSEWDREIAEKTFGLLDVFMKDVPIFCLQCKPNYEAVDVLEKTIGELLDE